MSYHVYIALEGFKETPIPLDAWLVAARRRRIAFWILLVAVSAALGWLAGGR